MFLVMIFIEVFFLLFHSYIFLLLFFIFYTILVVHFMPVFCKLYSL
ncbi:rCG27476 [Rattus norvegicus]|uniref:RCG27476 n=1 Tax=Rattus norvegicus TaxID=10116 RepID=A6KUW5_RAT|nr:rCG27476 [Rattus norvegicus]